MLCSTYKSYHYAAGNVIAIVNQRLSIGDSGKLVQCNSVTTLVTHSKTDVLF